MNRIPVKSENARWCGGPWLEAFALIVLAGISCATSTQAQTSAPPQTRLHGQTAAHPPTGARPPASTQAPTSTQPKKTPSGEEFFLVASIDQSKSEILLKRPSEVTLLLSATPKTQYLDESGKPLKLSDLRAGDTVWVISSGGAQPTAIRIRKGQMTIAELHRDYLDYPEIK